MIHMILYLPLNADMAGESPLITLITSLAG